MTDASPSMRATAAGAPMALRSAAVNGCGSPCFLAAGKGCEVTPKYQIFIRAGTSLNGLHWPRNWLGDLGFHPDENRQEAHRYRFRQGESLGGAP